MPQVGAAVVTLSTILPGRVLGYATQEYTWRGRTHEILYCKWGTWAVNFSLTMILRKNGALATSASTLVWERFDAQFVGSRVYRSSLPDASGCAAAESRLRHSGRAEDGFIARYPAAQPHGSSVGE
jgi:hypothetical protein